MIHDTLPRVAIGSVLLILVGLVLPMPATAGEDPVAVSVVRPFRDAVYNHQLTTEQLLPMYREILSGLGASGSAETIYARALCHYYLGRWHQAIKTTEEMSAYADELRGGHYLRLRRFYTERDEAMAAYSLARSECEKLLEVRSDSRSFSLYGEILGQILFLGDVGNLLEIGGKARRYVDKARDADPEYIDSLIQEASRLAYTPRAYGGDPDRAREEYRAILRIGVDDREDLFNIYGGFAMAAFSEGDDNEAISWFREAAGLYPGNIFAAGMIEYLEGTIGNGG